MKTSKKCGTLVAALAALSCSSIAHASTSSVKLYGLIDMGLAYERNSGESRLGLKDGVQSGSRWGLQGVEDLGDGYRVVFRLESGFHPTTGKQAQGSDRIFGRWAYMGLAGGFGEVRLGRQQVLSDSWGGVASPFGTGWSGAAASVTSGFNDGDFGSSGRVNNAVIYTTPTFNGWQAGLGYSFEAHDSTQFETANHDRVWTAGLRYMKGPLSAALTYERLNADSSEPAKMNASNLQLAGVYDFEWMKLHAGYGLLRNPNVGPSAGFKRINSFVGGASFPVGGSGRVLGSYQRATSSNIKGWAMGYQYDLSKRTNLYALLDRVDRRETHVLQTIVGMRHLF
ncbi:porin [Achromobacter seleniivolatilans]|uniref:Porin n=1 Tax=Achromobacter seleniivolatilans TaxID=3047478 RepID=A0ABY9M501_9BURK|nr:porin [Achromobacter sp. R39]WMD22071.1 porin [Achromobacter sp. R39]